MADMHRALGELNQMDDLAAQDSPIHRLHPLAKLLVTLGYIAAVVSFGKYALSGVLVMALYPALLFSLSGIPVTVCFRKLRVVLPLVMAVGLFNPFFDRAPMLAVGGVGVSGGVISMLTLMLKGVLCLSASFLLIATTGIDALCAALRILRVPGMLVTPAAAAQHGQGRGAVRQHAAAGLSRRILLCRRAALWGGGRRVADAGPGGVRPPAAR